MIPEIIAEIDFNRPADETDSKRRIVRLYASKTELYLHFELGKNPDDTLNLVLPTEEFMGKVSKAIAEQEVENEEH